MTLTSVSGSNHLADLEDWQAADPFTETTPMIQVQSGKEYDEANDEEEKENYCGGYDTEHFPSELFSGSAWHERWQFD
jgi:hypothetical protein